MFTKQQNQALTALNIFIIQLKTTIVIRNILINTIRNTGILRPKANIPVFSYQYCSKCQSFIYCDLQLSSRLKNEFAIDLQIHTRENAALIYICIFLVYKLIFAYLKHIDYICNGN